MRIGITGSQGVGKTTLANLLAERLSLPLIREQARVVARGMGAFSEDMLRRAPDAVANQFQQLCLKQQQIVESEHPDGFVADRTVVDNAAYWLTWNHAKANLYERYGYLRKCRDHARSGYDLIVYCPPTGKEPEDDGFRMINPVYQQEIDLLVHTLLLGWELHFVRVEGSVRQRMDQVCGVLEETFANRRTREV